MQPTYTINNKMSYILGISAYYHDAAAALIKDGEIIAAAQEERFTRIKNDASCLLYTSPSPRDRG